MGDDRTLARPDIVEAILDGRQPPEMNLATLVTPFPVAWEGQREKIAEKRTGFRSASAILCQAE